MKAILCGECESNNNGWCNRYLCNGSKRIEVCPKYIKYLRKGCKYCNIENGESKLITKGCWNNLFIDKNDEGEVFITAKADGIATSKINYCPYCGRKLVEDK